MKADAHFIVGAIDDDIWTELTDRFVRSGLFTARREHTVNAILHSVRDEDVDLVFCEPRLKDGNVFQLAEALDQYRPESHIPLIMIGENFSPLLLENAVEVGIELTIERPFQQDHLDETIRQALESRQN